MQKIGKTSKFRLVSMLFVLTVLLGACGKDKTEAGNMSGNPGGVSQSADENDWGGESEGLPVPEFSKEAGFYFTAFHLELTAGEGAQIYYTLDGSDPRTSQTAVLYEDKIKIYNNTKDPNVYSMITDITLGDYYPPQTQVDKAMVVRAAAKYDDEFSDVVCNSYFVGKNESYYSDFRVISMVTDGDYLFHPESGAYMVGAYYYEWLESEEYEELDPGDVNNPTNYNADGKKSEFPVSIQVFRDGDLVYTENCGARIAGNWTRAGAQKSFRFYARKELGNSKLKYAFFDDLLDEEGEVIDKFDKVTLRNGGNCHILHFRDAFIQELSQGLDLDYMASEPCILFVNGEFWGFYLLREKPEDYYIKSHYGIDDETVEVIKNGEVESGSDDAWGAYYDFTIWAATADMTKEENYQKFCEQMDVQSFMDYMTVETYVNNYDWMSGYTNNWMVWRTNVVDEVCEKADGRWRFILYDLDFSSGLYDSEDTTYYHDNLNTNRVDSEEFNLPAILRNLCRNDGFREQFYDNYIRIMEENFAPEKVSKLLAQYAGEYGSAVKATHERFGTEWAADSFDGEVDKLEKFYQMRPEYAREQLDYFIEHYDSYGDGIAGGDGVFENGSEDNAGLTGGQDSTNIVPDITWWYYYGDANVYVDQAQNGFVVNVPEKQANNWDVQLGSSEILLEKGKDYHLKFEASVQGDGEFVIFCNRFDGEGYPTQTINKMELSENMATYDFYFTWNMDTFEDWRLCLNYGLMEGEVVVKNLVLEEVG